MASSERIRQAQEAIVNHLESIRPQDWADLKKDFLDIPTSSFWRYVKKAKEQLEKPAAPTVRTDLFSPEAAPILQQEPWDNPQMNSAFRALGQAQRLSELHADILALREYALDSEGRIRDGQLFAKSIRLRTELLKDEVQIIDAISNADFSTRLFDAILKTVGNLEPKAANAIIDALQHVQAEFAMEIQGTPQAKIVN